MLYEDLDDSLKLLLKDYLTSQRVNLFIGSGVSGDSSGRQGPMLLTNDLRERLVEVNELPHTTSLELAYSTLTEQQSAEEITARYTCSRVGRTVERLACHPWKRVYTLNIDNAFEVAFRIYMAQRSFDNNSLEIGIYNDDYFDRNPGTRCSIIHLHGSVERPDQGYVFSHTEYVNLMTRPNPWLTVLLGLLRTETFIVAGTTLEEIDVTYYLKQRSSKSIRNDTPPSILIEPNPNRLTEMLCEQHEFCLFKGTVLDFFGQLEKQTHGQCDFWDIDRIDDGLSTLNLNRVARLKFSTTFELVPTHPMPDGDPNRDPMRFLLGAELTWYMLSKSADVPREIYPNIRTKVLDSLHDRYIRILLISDKPGTGKTALLRRLAFDLCSNIKNVFFYTGEFCDEVDFFATVLDSLPEDCIVFIDNLADTINDFSFLIPKLKKRNIIFVCADRDYRVPYIEAVFTTEDFDHINNLLSPTKSEINELLSMHIQNGLSTVSENDQAQVARLRSDEPISVACCRIQNNFKRFDRIVRELLSECDHHEKLAYTTVALAQHCVARGIRRQILSTISYFDAVEHLFSSSASLPVKYSDSQLSFVVPQQAVVGEIVLNLAAKRDKDKLLTVFVDLANALSPMVNRHTIRARSPESRLVGRLMDFDATVKRFIDEYAEKFYEEVKTGCEWNSRYWEQLALMKLDRFLASSEDSLLLQESLQHARSALTRESHPFSHTTLAKVLFQAMRAEPQSKEEYFNEAWDHVNMADQIESRWERRGATLFVVAFTGAKNFIEMGGELSGAQYDKIRDMIATTHGLKIKDRRLFNIRDVIRQILGFSV